MTGAGKAVRARETGVALLWRGLALILNPPRAVWRLFSNVRFAVLLLALLSLVSLLGVVIPQLPVNVRGDSVAEAQWLNSKQESFGFLTRPLDALGLFDVFHTPWFAMLMATTVASTAAYILSRLPGIWTSVTQPRKRVPDRYFDMAPNRFQTPAELDAEALESALRRRRYRVERFQENDVTYIFADRFAWAQFGTLLTHAAVIVFILSAAVSRMDAFESGLFLAEGSTLPVFPVRNPEQIQVELVDAHGEFSADGQPLDYRSDLVIYRKGEKVKRCSSTVNSPCAYGGYRFYQAAYFGFGAALQVRDLSSGNVIYRETLALSGRAPSPIVRIEDAEGNLLLDTKLVLTDELDTGDVYYRGTLVDIPGHQRLAIGLEESRGERRLVVLDTQEGPDGVAALLSKGETVQSGGLTITYVRESMTPAAPVADLPVPPGSTVPAASPYLQLSNVVYGTGTISQGTSVEPASSGSPPTLTISGLTARAMTMQPGQSEIAGQYEYTFLGPREFSGINVKRDRSNYLVWAGAALIVAGLLLTFWVPRRRLWARISSGGSALAGQAPGHARYGRDLERLGIESGAPARHNGDDDD